MRLPIADKNSNTGDLAVTISQQLFEQHNWKFRRQDGNTDYGIDAEIEMIESNYVTGRLIKLQIKGTQSIDWSPDETYRQSIKVETWNLWKSMSLPTFIILCSTSEREAYWAFPLTVAPKTDVKTVSIRFEREQCLSSAFTSFETFAKAVIRDFPDPSIVLEVPGFFEVYKNKLIPDCDWSDCFCEIDDDQDFLMRLFYKHVLRLRIFVGLSTTEIFPLEWFYLRSRSIADWTGGTLIREVFSELMDYLTPLYYETLEELKSRTKVVNISFENEGILNFFRTDNVFKGHKDELGKHDRISVRVRDYRIDAKGKFQRDFERRLQESNVHLRINLTHKTIG